MQIQKCKWLPQNRINFYIEVEKHVKLTTNMKPDNEQRIYSTYLNLHGKHINVPLDLINNIQLKLSEKTVNPFDDIQTYILTAHIVY